MLLNNFPTDIYQELLSWLEDDDQVAFAMVNRIICTHLIKHVRVLQLWGYSKNFEERFRSYFTSEKLQCLIADPYHQLNLSFPKDMDLNGTGFDDISINCKDLWINPHQFTTFASRRCVKKLQNLILIFDDPPSSYSLTEPHRYSLTEPHIRLIADWINNLDLGLKSLNFIRTNFIVNGWSVPAYFSNLHCLKLYQNNIEDVSSLDSIHELHLEYCDIIRDISCLNHNYKIVIECCTSINDYSNCFRYSKIIRIWCLPYPFRRPIKGLDLSKALEAREIYFTGGAKNKPLILPLSSNLQIVHAEDLPLPLTLPSGHHIREIKFGRDLYHPALTSLLQIGGIYSVKLISLKISSLEGLGSGNRVVEVGSCSLIADFSMLRHCDKVIISDCKGFQEVDQVRGVKDFIFCPADVEKHPRNMEGVTCLILKSKPDNLLSLKFPSTLRKLIINSDSRDLVEQLPLLLALLPSHVGKIEVLLDEKRFHSLLKKGEAYFPDFTIEFKRFRTHFLRKLD